MNNKWKIDLYEEKISCFSFYNIRVLNIIMYEIGYKNKLFG